MTAEQARQILIDAVAGAVSGLDNFALRGTGLAGAEISRFDLIDDMAGGVVNDVVGAVKTLTHKQFLRYDPSYQTSSSQVLVEDLDQVPELAAVDAAVRAGDVPYDDGGTPVIAMAHAVGAETSKIVTYRLKGPGIAMRRPSGIALIPRDGVYEPIEEDLLYYEPRFDTYTCASFCYFTSSTLIQSKLHADDKARDLARETLAAATFNVQIDGFVDLERAVMSDPTLRAKMAYVARLIQSDPGYAAKLTTANLISFVETYPDFDIKMSIIDGQKALLFDPSPQHRHQIPRLLADDYLHSYLTDRNYEAGSKQRAQA